MTMMINLYVVMLLGSCVYNSHSLKFPVRPPPTNLNAMESSDSSCSSQPTCNAIKRQQKMARAIINEHPEFRSCECGNPAWKRVIFFNMSDPRDQCPPNTTFKMSPVRGCGCQYNGSSGLCNPVKIRVSSTIYSRVCGIIYAYQVGISYAFAFSAWYDVTATINSPYVSGLSLTHGLAGKRKHIWTFAGAIDETHLVTWPKLSCPCINNAHTWPYKVPSYVGQSYFCDAGPHQYNHNNNHFTEDPLWDGEGCDGSSSCCNYNSPPWFCKDLKYQTMDDLEVRLFALAYNEGEDKVITLMEIYIK